MFDVVLVALNRCKDVHHDILMSSIFCVAAAESGLGVEAIIINDAGRLTTRELRFIEEWWVRCQLKYPELSRTHT